MNQEINRVKKVLAATDPTAPNYRTLLDNLQTLLYMVEHGNRCFPVAPSEIVSFEAFNEPTETVTEPVETKEEKNEVTWSIEQVRRVIKEVQASGVDAKAVITSYGVKSLSGIPAEQYGELVEALVQAEEDLKNG